MEMLPMSLYESGESNSSVSIAKLFENPNSFEGCESQLSVDELIFAICRWRRWAFLLIISIQILKRRDFYLNVCVSEI